MSLNDAELPFQDLRPERGDLVTDKIGDCYLVTKSGEYRCQVYGFGKISEYDHRDVSVIARCVPVIDVSDPRWEFIKASGLAGRVQQSKGPAPTVDDAMMRRFMDALSEHAGSSYTSAGGPMLTVYLGNDVLPADALRESLEAALGATEQALQPTPKVADEALIDEIATTIFNPALLDSEKGARIWQACKTHNENAGHDIRTAKRVLKRLGYEVPDAE